LTTTYRNEDVMKYCPECGSEVEEDIKFCGSCGGTLKAPTIGDAVSDFAKSPQVSAATDRAKGAIGSATDFVKSKKAEMEDKGEDKLKDKFNLKEFMDFRYMIMVPFIKGFFKIVIAFAAIVGLLIPILFAFAMEDNFILGFLLGIVIYIIGVPLYILVYRLLCETVLIAFSIHRELKELNDKTAGE